MTTVNSEYQPALDLIVEKVTQSGLSFKGQPPNFIYNSLTGQVAEITYTVPGSRLNEILIRQRLTMHNRMPDNLPEVSEIVQAHGPLYPVAGLKEYLATQYSSTLAIEFNDGQKKYVANIKPDMTVETLYATHHFSANPAANEAAKKGLAHLLDYLIKELK